MTNACGVSSPWCLIRSNFTPLYNASIPVRLIQKEYAGNLLSTSTVLIRTPFNTITARRSYYKSQKKGKNKLKVMTGSTIGLFFLISYLEFKGLVLKMSLNFSSLILFLEGIKWKFSVESPLSNITHKQN